MRPTTLSSKLDLTIIELARRLDGFQTGERIPKIEEFAAELGCGRGTVQAALRALDTAGALSVRSRGSRGSYVEVIRHGLLWEIAGRRSVTIALPLPYTSRYEGLASGLQASFSAHDIPLNLAFMRGSSTRVNALEGGRADLVLLSQMAADEDERLLTVQSFGPGSYLRAHVMVLAEGCELSDPELRVAVDPTSIDQVRLVEQAFSGQTITPIELSYNQLGRAFASGIVDATVWNEDEIRSHITTPVTIHPLAASGGVSNTTAVIAQLVDSPPLPGSVMAALVDPIIASTAVDIVNGTAIPTY